MIGNRNLAARRKLLSILGRAQLEELSQVEHPSRFTKTQLMALAAADKAWDLDEVHSHIERLFRVADPQGTSP